MTAGVIVQAGGLANRKSVVPASSDNHFGRSDWRNCESDALPLPGRKTIKSVLHRNPLFLTPERFNLLLLVWIITEYLPSAAGQRNRANRIGRNLRRAFGSTSGI